MLNLIRQIYLFFLDLFLSFIELLKSPFISHPCSQCDCASYTDEALFTWMSERSHLRTYAADMIAERIIHRPLSCSLCKHRRERHGTLKQKVLTPDMMPNGGFVYNELLERERIERRRNRFPSNFKLEEQIEIAVLKEGEGKQVRNGDEVALHYNAFVKETMERFESSEDKEPLKFTVGAGHMVQGLEMGVVGSNVGGRRRITVPSSLAYGAKMINGKREVDIVFDVQILAVLST